MADYVLSNAADRDLGDIDIYIYSHQTFGEAKADAYFLSLRECLETLAVNPRLGRPVPQLRRGLLCHRHARHLIFYVPEEGGVFIVRVLHDTMDPPRHIDPNA